MDVSAVITFFSVILSVVAVYLDPEEYDKIFQKQKDNEGLAHALMKASKPAAGFRSMGPVSTEPEVDYDGLDLVLTDEQREWLYGRHKNGSRVKRGGTTVKAKTWTDGVVPYVIVQTDFNDEETTQLHEAMKVYESETCVRFKPRTTQVAYAQFQRGTRGCNSWLGMGGKSMQPINLYRGCRTIGTYLHEIGHCLGLVHEHQLPQRDSFVYYNPTNVDPRYMSQLDKYDSDVARMYGAKLDLSSIMMYEPDAFSYDHKSHTLGVEDPFLAVHIGRRYSNMLSYGDVKMINRLYQCDRKCDSDQKRKCANGFLNENCECVTVDNYYSRLCVNDPEEEEECYVKLRQGRCRRSSYQMQKKCAKACDFCPRFKPGDTAKNPVDSCRNIYFDSVLCDQWASNGDCEHENENIKGWMQRNCKKSCKICQKQIGNCPNTWPDELCDRYSGWGTCLKSGRSADNVRNNCPDSCNICKAMVQGKCDNKLRDDICQRRAENRECQTNPLIMFQICSKTCNRCNYNTGHCRNIHTNERECLWWAAINKCSMGKDTEFMLMNCARACNSCDIAQSQVQGLWRKR